MKSFVGSSVGSTDGASSSGWEMGGRVGRWDGEKYVGAYSSGQYCGLPTSPAPHEHSSLMVDKKSSWVRAQAEQESSRLQAEEQLRHTELPGYEYSPAGHGVQVEAPAEDIVPAGHILAVPEPSKE